MMQGIKVTTPKRYYFVLAEDPLPAMHAVAENENIPVHEVTALTINYDVEFPFVFHTIDRTC